LPWLRAADGLSVATDERNDAMSHHSRLVWDPKERGTCHDCGVLEGQIHIRGCDMERCPFCLGQLISCNCSLKHFYPEFRWQAEPFCNLPQDVYESGLPADQDAEWDRLLIEKGRIPYLLLPNLCARCGQTWPDMFSADDWQDVIPANAQEHMLCLPCYEAIKIFVLAGREEAKSKEQVAS
jgi:hypothetical protein